MPLTTPHPAPTTLTARCPEDILALVPVLLGFVPSESVVMLTFGAADSFHARVDAPPGSGEVADVVGVLLEPARRHRVRAVVFVVYSHRVDLSGSLAAALHHEFTAAGIEVPEMLRADGARWFPLLPGREGGPQPGVPYDVGAHPFLAQAVLRGRVTLGSREALAASLAVDPVRAARVDELVGDLPRWCAADEPSPQEQLVEGAWVEGLVRDHTAAGDFPDDVEVARLLRAIQLVVVRDAAWSVISRATAERHVAFWTDVCRRTPAGLLAPAAGLLGWAAWQAGHGALAWCAADLAAAADPDYVLTHYLVHVLEHAVPPTAWEPPGDWRGGLMSS